MDSQAERSDGFAMAVVVEGGLALIAVAVAWIFGVPLRDMFPAAGAPLVDAILRGLLATLPMLVIFWLLIKSDWPMMRQLRDQVELLIDEMFPSRSVAQFATVATLAGVGEELLFRGALQSIVGNWTTPLIGLAVTSLLFGLAHALSKLYFAFAVVVGAFLGWMTWHYNDLVAPMVSHGLYDFLALAYLSRRTQQHATAKPPSITDQTTRSEND